MPGFLTKTASVIIEELAAMFDHRPAPSSASYDRVVHFALEQLDRMPWFLGIGVKCSTVAFGISSLLINGRPFHLQSEALRRKQLISWRHSSLGICRVLIKFYASLTVLALHPPAEPDFGNDAV
jgi:hypothetical protein